MSLEIEKSSTNAMRGTPMRDGSTSADTRERIASMLITAPEIDSPLASGEFSHNTTPAFFLRFRRSDGRVNIHHVSSLDM